MKKILIATTALVMTAGVALAESHGGPTLSGSARMGLVHDSLNTGNENKFSSRVRFAVTGSGTTDGGLTFGASYRIDQTGGNNDNTKNGDSTVFLSGEFGKITMGDVGGAADALVGQTDGVGFGPNDGVHEIGFVGTTKTAVYYERAFGALTFGLGLGQPGDANKNELSVAAKYATDVFSVALGYEGFDNNPSTTVDANESLLSLKGTVTLGAATIKARYSTSSITNVEDDFSISASGTFGGVGVTAVFTQFGGTTNGNNSTTVIGLGASYDLGGGASVAGAILQKDFEATGAKDQTLADLGVKFSF